MKAWMINYFQCLLFDITSPWCINSNRGIAKPYLILCYWCVIIPHSSMWMHWKCKPDPLLSYFPWLCAWDSRAIIGCWFHTNPGKAGFVSLITVQCYHVHNCFSALWPDSRICLCEHHATSSSSLCRPIWRYLSSKMFLGAYCLKCVFKIKSIHSITFHALSGAVRIQHIHLSYHVWEYM